MNPDENNINQPGGEPPVVPDAPATPDTPVAPEIPATPDAPATPETPPNLDQVAADLSNASPIDVAPDTTPAVEPTPAAEPAPTAPFEPTPAAEPAPTAPFEPTPATPETPAMPEAPVVPEAPVILEAPATPEAPTEPMPEERPQESSYSTSANFVDDAVTPEENIGQPATSGEEEEPLIPAEPVPGSIGSALAYSDTAPDHAMPVEKPSRFKLKFNFGNKPKGERKPLTKDNIKLLIAIVGGVALVAVVAVIIFFIVSSNSNSSNKSSSDTKPSNNTTPTNVVTSLTCDRSGDASIYGAYGAVSTGSDQMIAMYSNDVLSSFGTTLTLVYDDEEAAKNGQSIARGIYDKKLTSAGLTQDPFTSAYDANGNVVTVTHQAEGSEITAKNARVLNLYIVKGEPVTDIDTLLDTYKSDGYTCLEK